MRKRATAAQRREWDRMRLRGCAACLLRGISTGQRIEIHHITDRGRRLGHNHAVALCHYHHQGKFLPGAFTSYKAAAALYGPSLEREPARFREAFPSILPA